MPETHPRKPRNTVMSAAVGKLRKEVYEPGVLLNEVVVGCFEAVGQTQKRTCNHFALMPDHLLSIFPIIKLETIFPFTIKLT